MNVNPLVPTGLEVTLQLQGRENSLLKIFLLGAGAEIPEVVKALMTDSWAKNIPFRETREVSLMEIEGLPVTDATGVVKSKDWFSNAVLSIIYKEIFDK